MYINEGPSRESTHPDARRERLTHAGDPRAAPARVASDAKLVPSAQQPKRDAIGPEETEVACGHANVHARRSAWQRAHLAKAGMAHLGGLQARLECHNAAA